MDCNLIACVTLSNDPQFAAKLRDIVGLYVNPPDHAIVLSIWVVAKSADPWFVMSERHFGYLYRRAVAQVCTAADGASIAVVCACFRSLT
jgi:hypothetical protein